jgi:hypothetical protein
MSQLLGSLKRREPEAGFGNIIDVDSISRREPKALLKDLTPPPAPASSTTGTNGVLAPVDKVLSNLKRREPEGVPVLGGLDDTLPILD